MGCASGENGIGPFDSGIGADDVATVPSPEADSSLPATGLDASVPHDDSGPSAGGGADSGVDSGSEDASTQGGMDAGGPGSGKEAGPFPSDDSGIGSFDAAAIDAAESDAETSALIGKWNFDEGTGTTSADLSGHGHPATFVGGATWAAAGKEGAGLALDGATGYADVGVTLIDTAESFSVLCWVNLTVVDAWKVALSQDDVTGSLFGLKMRGDTNDFDFDVETSDVTNPGFVVAASTTPAQASTWTHLAGVYDASGSGSLAIYLNGVMQANAAVGQSLLASSGHFVIGRGLYNGATGSFLAGTIDEVAVFSIALTTAEVQGLYVSGE
jgi:Concanavalin A-like lectin/glucanases superfamily